MISVAPLSTVDQISKLLEAAGSLISAVAWPALILFIVWRFREPISGLASDVRTAVREGRATVKAGPAGIEISTAEAAALIQTAEAQRGGGESGEDGGTDKVTMAANAVEEIAEVVNSEPDAGPRVLWVDDSPTNNRIEERALRELGFEVRFCLSTDEALLQLSREPFDLVISDLGRPGDRKAGFTLIERMRERGYETPVIIYTIRASAEDREQARLRGAFGQTASPSELVELVARALRVDSAATRRRAGARQSRAPR
jgi:CheY-like chemotaxis protein